MLQYLQLRWSGILSLVADRDMQVRETDITFEGSVKSYSHLHLKKTRYGAATAHRGKSARYAYTGLRNPVEIQWLFQVEQVVFDGEPLVVNLAVVRHFQRDENVHSFPWELWCVSFSCLLTQSDNKP